MNPQTGSFTSVDPYEGEDGTPITLNKYLYANASPAYFVDPTGEFGIAAIMAMIAMQYTTSVSVVQNYSGFIPKKKYSLIIYMNDYYDIGVDGKKHTGDDPGIVSFPGPYYQYYLDGISNMFKEESAINSKATFQLVNTVGIKPYVSNYAAQSEYSAILSHSSASFPGLFPSLQELSAKGMSADHLTPGELGKIRSAGRCKGLHIAACKAGRWASGGLDATSMESTRIETLLDQAVEYLFRMSEGE